jgi:hypothetical protein
VRLQLINLTIDDGAATALPELAAGCPPVLTSGSYKPAKLHFWNGDGRFSGAGSGGSVQQSGKHRVGYARSF